MSYVQARRSEYIFSDIRFSIHYISFNPGQRLHFPVLEKWQMLKNGSGSLKNGSGFIVCMIEWNQDVPAYLAPLKNRVMFIMSDNEHNFNDVKIKKCNISFSVK